MWTRVIDILQQNTLKFRFPEENAEWWSGYFVVRFSDALDPTNYFEVEYRSVDEKYKYTGAFALYKGQVRTSRYYGIWYSAEFNVLINEWQKDNQVIEKIQFNFIPFSVRRI